MKIKDDKRKVILEVGSVSCRRRHVASNGASMVRGKGKKNEEKKEKKNEGKWGAGGSSTERSVFVGEKKWKKKERKSGVKKKKSQLVCAL